VLTEEDAAQAHEEHERPEANQEVPVVTSIVPTKPEQDGGPQEGQVESVRARQAQGRQDVRVVEVHVGLETAEELLQYDGDRVGRQEQGS